MSSSLTLRTLRSQVPCSVPRSRYTKSMLAKLSPRVHGLVAVGNLVGPHLHAPRVGGDGGELTLVEPAGRREREPRRVPAGVVAPATLLLAHRHLSGPDEQGIAGTDLHVMRADRGVEILGRDRIPGSQPVHALDARNVEQDATGDDAASHLVDAVLLGSFAADEVGVVAVVELAVLETVGERVPLRPALERHDDHVVGDRKG